MYPTLIVEVLSNSTKTTDKREKRINCIFFTWSTLVKPSVFGLNIR
ncbi:MAG: hypothetical protein VKL59_24060 [Nostocaceae cyanobacterium]|nr:hypothetical protein [Nostocaceae cyanobacterium]